MPGRRVAAGSAQKRRQHLLQAADKIVGFAIAFDQSIDGAVFAIDLLAQEVAFIPGNFELALKMCDIARRLPCRGWFCRGLSRPVVVSRRGLSWFFVVCRCFVSLLWRWNSVFHDWRYALCRGLSLHVVRCRCFVSRLLRMHRSFHDRRRCLCRGLSRHVGLIL